MDRNPDNLVTDFISVAQLAGVTIPRDALALDFSQNPHIAPRGLPSGKMAVYVFAQREEVLKVGKVGPKSQPRYTSQHYNPDSAQSTLARSILAEKARYDLSNEDAANVGQWMKRNLDRTNFLLDEHFGIRVLTLLEAFLQCRLKPRYEGFKSQNVMIR